MTLKKYFSNVESYTNSLFNNIKTLFSFNYIFLSTVEFEIILKNIIKKKKVSIYLQMFNKSRVSIFHGGLPLT